jgi:hypothetical protein
MEDYRAVHHAKYLERVRVVERWKRIHEIVDSIHEHVDLTDIRASVSEIMSIVQEPVKELDFGLKLVEAINTNKAIVVQLDNPVQVTMSRKIQEDVKTILGLCGLDDTIEVQYDMDCSRDEEIARNLAEPDPVPPVVRRRGRGRPRRE